MVRDKMLKLAEQGDPVAQYNLGVTYAQNQTNPEKAQLAIHWWTKAAAQGHQLAQYNLGHCYAEGNLVEQNGIRAVRWFTAAAENGVAQAQFVLGLFFQQGRFVKQNLDQAIDWYQKAGEQGYRQAVFNLAHLFSVAGERFDPHRAYALFGIAQILGDQNAEARMQELARHMTPEQLERAHKATTMVMANAMKYPLQ